MKYCPLSIVTTVAVLLISLSSLARATPINFQIIDVYSSISTAYSFADLSDADSFYQETHGTYTSSLSKTFDDFGPLTGSTQDGTISASPLTGSVRATGSSFTNVSPFEGTFTSWGKHVVIGRFIVPDVGRVFTDIYLDVDFHSSIEGQALYRVVKAADWDPDKYRPDGYTSWFGVNELDQLITFKFSPGELIYFAFGIEPGVGAGGMSFLTNLDATDVTFKLLSDTPIAPPVPLPSALLLLGSGLTRLALYRRRKLSAKH